MRHELFELTKIDGLHIKVGDRFPDIRFPKETLITLFH